MLANCQI